MLRRLLLRPAGLAMALGGRLPGTGEAGGEEAIMFVGVGQMPLREGVKSDRPA